MEEGRDPRKCSATKQDGTPCTKWRVLGSTVCQTHGAGAPQVRQRAAERRQQAQILKALGDVPVENVDPAEALLRLVSMKWAETLWLRSKVRELPDSTTEADDDAGDDADTLVWGRTKHEQGIGPQGPIDKTDYAAEANIWWRLLREAEDQLAKYSTAALRAGVERRQLELQEAQAVHLASAINRILDALELTAEQQAQVPRIVPEVLRTLPMEGSN